MTPFNGLRCFKLGSGSTESPFTPPKKRSWGYLDLRKVRHESPVCYEAYFRNLHHTQKPRAQLKDTWVSILKPSPEALASPPIKELSSATGSPTFPAPKGLFDLQKVFILVL